MLAAISLVEIAGGFVRLELALYDRLVAVASHASIDTHVAVIRVTEQDIERFGWRSCADSLIARTLKTTAQLGASAIAVDVYRDSLPVGWAPDDRVTVTFARKLAEGRTPAVKPPRGADHTGFTDLVVDGDGPVRRALYLAGQDSSYVSLSFSAAADYLAQHGVELGQTRDGLPKLGAWTLVRFAGDDGGYRRADASGYQTLFRFDGAPREIPSVTLADVLDGRPEAAAALRGRAVFFGVIAPSLPDVVSIPVTTSLDQPAGTPGVVIQAMMASQAIRFALGEAAPLRVPPRWLQWMLIVLATLLAALVAARANSTAQLVGVLALVPAALIVVAYVAMQNGLWLPVGAPGVAWLTSGGAAAAVLTVRNKRERAAVMRLFSRHLSPRVADDVWRRRDEFLAGGRPRPQQLPASVLFADLKGYSTMAESAAPAELMEWINTFTEAMATEIMRHGGVVDDYAGDGIKAVWGVPLVRQTSDDVQRDARDAVSCALAMEQALVRLNDGWRAASKPGGALRIGIASGDVVAGSIGGSDRLKYTVVGDVVNVAARLESLDAVPFDPNERPCRILVESGTRSRLDGAFDSDSLGEFIVKGRREPVSVFAVTARAAISAPRG